MVTLGSGIMYVLLSIPVESKCARQAGFVEVFERTWRDYSNPLGSRRARLQVCGRLHSHLCNRNPRDIED